MSKYTNLLSDEIRERIESYIIDNTMLPHDKLPSERFFAELFGVNRQTVRTALKQLKNEHHLYTLRGKGNFISPPKYKDETDLLASFSKGWKTIISSRRLMNSGRKKAFRFSRTSFSDEPVAILEVIIKKVFLKSTVRP